MAVKPSAVKVGACFRTSAGQVRKVAEIVDGKVNYLTRGREYRGEKHWGYGVGKSQLPTIEKFASQVLEKWPCTKDVPAATRSAKRKPAKKAPKKRRT